MHLVSMPLHHFLNDKNDKKRTKRKWWKRQKWTKWEWWKREKQKQTKQKCWNQQKWTKQKWWKSDSLSTDLFALQLHLRNTIYTGLVVPLFLSLLLRILPALLVPVSSLLSVTLPLRVLTRADWTTLRYRPRFWTFAY